MEFRESRTHANLMAAFAGESQARNKYTFYSQVAKTEGYEQIADIFTETANNEKAHARLWLKALHGGSFPSTKDNLKDAASGENFEWTKMYAEFSAVAKEEGYDELAKTFELIGKVEKEHEERFNTLLENLEKGIVFSKTNECVWQCRHCGHLHVGKNAPLMCPACKHPQAYFEIKANNY